MNIGKVPQSIFGNPGYPTSYVGSVDDRDALIENLPGPGHWRILYIPYFAAASEGWSVQIAIGAVDNAGLCWRKARGFTWAAWENAATPTPPQELSLPLAEGVTTVGAGYKNIYSKDQFGIVRVWFSVHFESIPASGTHVFNLPEGFRPDSTCCAAAVLSMAEYYNAIVAIHPSGDALVDHGTIGQSGAINLHGFIEFPAAS